MRAKIACLVLASSITLAHADERVRSSQEELRRRNLYFGDVDGKPSSELDEAMKRYQKRKGFAASGRADDDTLRSLGLLERQPGEAPPKELEWPDETVLKSDARIDVPKETERLSSETGVPVEGLSPAIGERGAPRDKRAGRSRTTQTAQPVAPPVRSRLKGVPPAQQLDDQQLRKFVENYLRVVSHRDLLAELCFYADRVSFYRNGVVDRRLVERALRDYYLRWPKASMKLVGNPAYLRERDRGQILVVFRVNFALKTGGRKISGQTENRLVIQGGTSKPRILSIDEVRVRH